MMDAFAVPFMMSLGRNDSETCGFRGSCARMVIAAPYETPTHLY